MFIKHLFCGDQPSLVYFISLFCTFISGKHAFAGCCSCKTNLRAVLGLDGTNEEATADYNKDEDLVGDVIDELVCADHGKAEEVVIIQQRTEMKNESLSCLAILAIPSINPA